MAQFGALIQYRNNLIAAGCELFHHFGEEPSQPRCSDDEHVLHFHLGIRLAALAASLTQPQKHAGAQQSENQQHEMQDRDRPRNFVETGQQKCCNGGKRRDQDARLDEFERISHRIVAGNRRTGLEPLKHQQRRQKRGAAIGGGTARPQDRAIAQQIGRERADASPQHVPNGNTRQKPCVRRRLSQAAICLDHRRMPL